MSWDRGLEVERKRVEGRARGGRTREGESSDKEKSRVLKQGRGVLNRNLEMSGEMD